MLGLVIIGALIVVALKHTGYNQYGEASNQLASSNPSISAKTGEAADMRATPSVYQAQLMALWDRVKECEDLVPPGQDSHHCEAVLQAAIPQNIESLTQNLTGWIEDAKLSQNITSLQSFLKLQSGLAQERNTSYSSILQHMQPFLVVEEEEPEQRLAGEESGGSKSLVPLLVTCDLRRELRCRDQSACYAKEKHCDFTVDCEDNSDEDNCSCLQRLIDDRQCDSYYDCADRADETECGCGLGEFFCARPRAWDSPECVPATSVCDGQADCSNGRDEADCFLLGKEGSLSPDRAGSAGILAVWSYDAAQYIRVPKPNVTDWMVEAACSGVAGSKPIKQDQPGAGVQVDCGSIQCGLNQESTPTLSRKKRAHDKQVLLCDDIFNDEESEAIGQMAIEDREHYLNYFNFAVRIKERMLEDNVPGNLTMQYLSIPNFQGSTLLQEAFPNRSFAEFTAEMESYSNVSVNNDLNSFLWRLSFMSNRGIKDYKDCLSVDSGNRIVGGDISYEDSWPYTVAVYRDGRFICGATILSPQWVVTAGHCLFQYEEGDGKFYYVRAGMIRRQSQSAWEQHRSLQQIFIHPEYDK